MNVANWRDAPITRLSVNVLRSSSWQGTHQSAEKSIIATLPLLSAASSRSGVNAASETSLRGVVATMASPPATAAAPATRLNTRNSGRRSAWVSMKPR